MREMLKCISLSDAYLLPVKIYVCVLINEQLYIYGSCVDDLTSTALTVDCLCLCVYYRNGDC